MLDLKALNESFDRINLIKTSGKLFEEFTGDESESGIDKEDILDWLSEHEQLWNDCEKHFVQDPTWLSADELESFICDHDQACKDYAKAFGLFFDEEEELDESFDRFLTEAKISPEDKHDSDVIRSIYAKMRQPGRKQFSHEETAVMKKYGLDFSRDNRGRRDNLVLVNKDGDYLPYYQDYKNNDKVNYADKARKASERHQDSKYKRDNPRWNPENQSNRNPKQTWSRWQDDQEMKSDYRDKYRDLYTKRMFINSNKAQLDLEKDYLSRLQQQVADTENNVKANQQSYDQQKAEWKKMLADRRAKKNESLLKKYDHALKQSVTLYENFNSSKKSLKESYKVYVFHNTACAERRPIEPQDIWDFQEEDCSNEDQVLDYICNDLGLSDYDDYDNLKELTDSLSQDFGDGSSIVYRIEKDGKTIFEDSADYFEELKNNLQIELEGEQDKLYSENGVQREDIIDWLEENYPDLYDEAESVFEDRYGDELENAFADDIESFIAEEDENAWAEYCREFKIVNESLKKYSHIFDQPVTLYENFNPSKKSLTEAKKDKILDQLDKEDYQLIKSIYPESTMIIVGHPGNKKVFSIDYEHSGFGGYYHCLKQVFPETKKWNDEGEAYREFFKKIPNWGEPISRKEGQQQEVAYLQSKYDRVLVIPQKKWLQIAQAEVPLDIDDTEPKEDEFDPPVQFYYGVYELDNDGDELDHISDFNTEEEAIKFAKKQSFPTHVVFIPSIDPDDDPEIAEYMQSNAPYEAYETIWSSLEEDLEEAKEFNFDKLNKKLHGNIRL